MFKSLLLFLFVLQVGCGIFKRELDDNSSSPKKPYEADYLSTEAALNKLQQLDSAGSLNDSQKIQKQLLLNNLFHNIANDRVNIPKIKSYLSKRRGGHRGTQYRLEKQAPVPSLKVSVPFRRSIRVPVKSYCLNSHRHSPSSTTRYRLDKLTNERLTRSIALYHGKLHPEQAMSQSAIWDLERDDAVLSSISGLTAILEQLNFRFDSNETVATFEQRKSTKSRVKRLGINAQVLPPNIEMSFIGPGFSHGNLIIYNSGDRAVDLDIQALQLRFVPTRVVSQPSFAAVTNIDSQALAMFEGQYEPLPDVQNIGIQGIDPTGLNAGNTEAEYKVDEAIQLDEQIENILDQEDFPAEVKEALDLSRDFGLDMMAQGEYEDGQARLKATLEMARKIAEGSLDLATAFTPGVNDVRDLYEATKGKDLITGEKLATWQRMLSAAGLIVGSGAAGRKVVDVTGRIAGEGAEAAHKIFKSVAEALDPGAVSKEVIASARKGLEAFDKKIIGGAEQVAKEGAELAVGLGEVLNRKGTEFANAFIDYVKAEKMTAGKAGVVSEFVDGYVKYMRKTDYDQFVSGASVIRGTAGADEVFMVSKHVADRVEKTTNGNLLEIADRLGLEKKSWEGKEVVRIDLPFSFESRPRVPSGFERGVNKHFRYGGFTKGGLPEIIVNTPSTTGLKVTPKGIAE